MGNNPKSGIVKIFIVEDDEFYGRMLKHQVELDPDNRVSLFYKGAEVLPHLDERPDLITLDYSLPDTSCEELIARIKKALPDTPIIVVSAQENISTAIELLKKGAYDYIEKNEKTKERIWGILRNLQERKSLKSELAQLKTEVANKFNFSNTIKGSSASIQRVFDLMKRASETNITVSLIGETGTGKELVAKAIHYNSQRAEQSFIPVNISAIPEGLIESELFGCEKGAFTGAENRRIGKFEEANHGTIFLDEVAEMSMHLQSKLLRVLQEKEVERLGGGKPIKLDLRLIVATHKDLAEEVRNGNFREDLYYRLLGLPIILPPLRERGNDALLLARYFADEFVKINQMKPIDISEEAKKKLLEYPYPGNVCELKAVIELAIVMSDAKLITAKDISFRASRPITNMFAEGKSLKELNKMIVEHYLEQHNNNVLQVAEVLDIGKSTIYRMLKEEKL